jgi:GWxTD domain-containing protein
MSISSQLRSAALVAGCLLFAPSLFAGLSPEFNEWRNGPVQWIMTSQEKRQWKELKSDADASRFIDLFWARRDPTVGTPQNEALDEFDTRVRFADRHFAEGKLSGSMTDKGRVLVILGFASNQQGEAQWNTNQNRAGNADAGFDPTGGHDLGAREAWTWTREDALKKFGIPKVEVVFIQDPIKKITHRDPQRGDFYAAEGEAMKRQIVSPNLTAVPSWALYGGIKQNVPQLQASGDAAPAPVAVAAPTTKSKSTTTAAPYVPPKINVPTGVSRLVLTRDVMSVDTQGTKDPLKTMEEATTFHDGDIMGWALQYCSSADETPVARLNLKITGKAAAGRNVTRAAPEDEVMLERVKILPGCYLLRGEIPLAEMGAGDYALQVAIQDVDTKKNFDVKQPFKVE